MNNVARIAPPVKPDRPVYSLPTPASTWPAWTDLPFAAAARAVEEDGQPPETPGEMEYREAADFARDLTAAHGRPHTVDDARAILEGIRAMARVSVVARSRKGARRA